jgi:hypothetical protein
MNLHTRKFTDQQFLQQYNKGLNDVEISYIYQTNADTIRKRRWKLNLLPNWRITTTTITNPAQQLKHEHKLAYRNQQKPWRKRNPQKKRQYEHTYILKHKEQYKAYMKQYQQQHREYFREACRKYQQRKKQLKTTQQTKQNHFALK